MIRLQKILSAAGVASRRTAETLIAQGRVRVNGKVVTELGTKADPATDEIKVDERRLPKPKHTHYILLNKPRGYITSRSDPQHRPTVIELLARGGVSDYIYPVGRLDYDSEGLLILTSDGDLAARLTHPRHGVAREYEVRLRGVPDNHALERLARGVTIDGRRTADAEVHLRRVYESESGPQGILSLIIHEGRNRQVRKMCDSIGHPVVQLRRVRIGPIADDRLKPGMFRALTPSEINALKKGVPAPAAKSKGPAGPATRERRPRPATKKGARPSSHESRRGVVSERERQTRSRPAPRRQPRSRPDRPRRG
jgi:23S rRNA pseudouridine2605 synthase